MKNLLKAGASAVALGLIFAHPAAAFDSVEWNWTGNIDEQVNIDLHIDAANSLFPTGITQVERLQVSSGSITAASYQDNTVIAPEGPVIVFGKVIHLPADGLDAVDHLGRLEGNATAAANLASLNSDASTYFHDGQVAFGRFEVIDTVPEAFQALGAGLTASLVLPTGNQNLDALAAAAFAAQFGLIRRGTVDAHASATDVENAQVALNATGAGNLHTVTVGPSYTPKFVGLNNRSPEYKTDSIVIGDLNQFSLMNVSASADASNLTVTGYERLGKLKDQYGTWTAVSSVNASAFGNMSSITNRVNGLAPLPYVK